MKLEDRVLKKVYVFETKRTLVSAIVKFLSVGALVCATIIVSGVLIQSLIDRETLSVFEIFREDLDSLPSYIYDTVYVVAVEIPKGQLILLLLGCVSLGLTIITLYKNFRRIRNKIFAILAYWLGGRKSRIH